MCAQGWKESLVACGVNYSGATLLCSMKPFRAIRSTLVQKLVCQRNKHYAMRI
jgi:hypothetical protein